MINSDMQLLYGVICSVQNVATCEQVRGEKRVQDACRSQEGSSFLLDDNLHNLIEIYNDLDRWI
jgi:hypothetical protein